MPRFRDIKRKARGQLHERLSESAWYLSTPEATPVAVTVRLHLSFDAVGELLRGGFGERHETTPRIVFLASEASPRRGGVVITEDMGAFQIDTDLPPDDLTISTEVVRLSTSQITAFGWNPHAEWLGFAAIT